MTANELSSTIINNVTDALSGAILNRAITTDQIEGEIDLLREKLFFEQLKTGKVDLKYFLQNIDSIQLTCRDLTKDCGALPSQNQIPSIKIPKLAATQNDSQIEYLGLANKQKKFIVYYDTDDIINHSRRMKTSSSPFAWVDLTPDHDDLITIYFFNLDKYNNLKFVDIRAIFAKPTQVKPLDPDYLYKEYPAPGYIQEMIISTLSERYLRYYRQLNLPNQANNQQDNVI